MPLTALHADRTRIEGPTCEDVLWRTVYRVTPRARLSCRDCGASMHARISKRGLRHFAHDRAQPGCPSEGETPDHLALKALLARCAMELGHKATLEARPEPQDHGGWRADVLIETRQGARIALEAQLAPMTVAVGRDRSDSYAKDGIRVVWVSTKHATWMTRLPGFRVTSLDDDATADRGMACLEGAQWVSVTAALKDVIAQLANGELTKVHPNSVFVEEVPEVSSDACPSKPSQVLQFRTENPCLLVPVSEESKWRCALEAEKQRRRIEEDKIAKERMEVERQKKNKAELAARRKRVTSQLVTHLFGTMMRDELLIIGAEKFEWSARTPVPIEWAVGSELSAFGALIGVGTAEHVRQLFVVVPVSTQCTADLGERWRRPGIRVVVESRREAIRVADRLGWQPDEVELIGQILNE